MYFPKIVLVISEKQRTAFLKMWTDVCSHELADSMFTRATEDAAIAMMVSANMQHAMEIALARGSLGWVPSNSVPTDLSHVEFLELNILTRSRDAFVSHFIETAQEEYGITPELLNAYLAEPRLASADYAKRIDKLLGVWHTRGKETDPEGMVHTLFNLRKDVWKASAGEVLDLHAKYIVDVSKIVRDVKVFSGERKPYAIALKQKTLNVMSEVAILNNLDMSDIANSMLTFSKYVNLR